MGGILKIPYIMTCKVLISLKISYIMTCVVLKISCHDLEGCAALPKKKPKKTDKIGDRVDMQLDSVLGALGEDREGNYG